MHLFTQMRYAAYSNNWLSLFVSVSYCHSVAPVACVSVFNYGDCVTVDVYNTCQCALLSTRYSFLIFGVKVLNSRCWWVNCVRTVFMTFLIYIIFGFLYISIGFLGDAL